MATKVKYMTADRKHVSDTSRRVDCRCDCCVGVIWENCNLMTSTNSTVSIITPHGYSRFVCTIIMGNSTNNASAAIFVALEPSCNFESNQTPVGAETHTKSSSDTVVPSCPVTKASFSSLSDMAALIDASFVMLVLLLC